ncbi:hypothetical protein CR205_03175 [Alteribacter lacisalsi]|uniref:Uncharacterized protein n=1 Tax=Alteribacter lacisalsi TaxID=2045244 RepID=A0A2W0H9K5_9BACI|nr:hypothetical protein [Alteribacter lacisalsi]PYZ97611.1 hypothetical protein CR205_03175 [Alteribacter lacisalsi]
MDLFSSLLLAAVFIILMIVLRRAFGRLAARVFQISEERAQVMVWLGLCAVLLVFFVAEGRLEWSLLVGLAALYGLYRARKVFRKERVYS